MNKVYVVVRHDDDEDVVFQELYSSAEDAEESILCQIEEHEGVYERSEYEIRESFMQPRHEKVWFDFGDGDQQEFTFDTEKEMDAFIQGVSAAASGFGLEDYRQYDSEEEVKEAKENEL